MTNVKNIEPELRNYVVLVRGTTDEMNELARLLGNNELPGMPALLNFREARFDNREVPAS
jgi:hypothetical protein